MKGDYYKSQGMCVTEMTGCSQEIVPNERHSKEIFQGRITRINGIPRLA